MNKTKHNTLKCIKGVNLMTTKEKELRCDMEKTWLFYFNKYLLDHNVISEKEFYTMNNKIISAKKAK